MESDKKTYCRLENISKSFGEKTILDNICLAIQENDFIVIKGSSGAGKSTLLNIIGLLTHASSGNVIINGRNTYSLSGDELCRSRSEHIGFIFQEGNLLPDMTVYENLCVPFIIKHSKKNARKKIESLLNQCNLIDLSDKNVNSLSGGEKQRIALLRSFMGNPKIILADEPSGNLDPDNEKIIIGLLHEFCKAGGSVVVVTHSKGYDTVCNKKYLLQNKTLQEEML